MALENRPLQKEVPIENHHFRGSMLVFGGVWAITIPSKTPTNGVPPKLEVLSTKNQWFFLSKQSINKSSMGLKYVPTNWSHQFEPSMQQNIAVPWGIWETSKRGYQRWLKIIYISWSFHLSLTLAWNPRLPKKPMLLEVSLNTSNNIQSTNTVHLNSYLASCWFQVSTHLKNMIVKNGFIFPKFRGWTFQKIFELRRPTNSNYVY